MLSLATSANAGPRWSAYKKMNPVSATKAYLVYKAMKAAKNVAKEIAVQKAKQAAQQAATKKAAKKARKAKIAKGRKAFMRVYKWSPQGRVMKKLKVLKP